MEDAVREEKGGAAPYLKVVLQQPHKGREKIVHLHEETHLLRLLIRIDYYFLSHFL